MYNAIFYLFAGITLGSAIIVVSSQNILRSAFALLFTFFGVAGLYVFLGADFLAATQLLIYVGGILVLILFAVMLTQRIGMIIRTNPSHSVARGLLATVGLLVLLLVVVFRTSWQVKEVTEPLPTTAEVGRLLLTDFVLPFEVVSVLLVAALVGAALLARKEEEE